MLSLRLELDRYLLDLAWSLWTELGVAGVKRKHQDCLITLEELILLTATLAETDPRLRDESLDWCSQYYRFLSISRLKSIIKNFDDSLMGQFSKYSATLNALSGASWPVFVDSQPLCILLSRKSCLRPLESAALLNIRARSIFGPGARADLVSFFLTHSQADFSAADLTEIGYSKRNLAEVLDDLSFSGLFDKFMLRNQQRYRLSKNDQLVHVLGPVPHYAPAWSRIFQLIFSLRDCIIRTENSSESTKVVEIRNLLILQEINLKMLNREPPPFQTNFRAYLSSFREWLLEIVRNLSQGNPDKG